MAAKKPASTLDRLTAAATDVTETKAAKKDSRPTITLKGRSAAAFDGLVGADAVLKVAMAGQTERKRSIVGTLRAMFLKLCIRAGVKVENPHVATDASNAILQVKHVSAVSPVYGPAGDPIKLPDQLRALEVLPEEVVQEIMVMAIELHTETRLKSFDEMLSGNAEERAIGEKMASYVRKFTEENQAAMLQRVSWETVRPCWGQLSVSIACRLADGDLDRGVEILGALWSVLPVDPVLAQYEFGGDKAEAFGALLAAK